MSDDPWNKINKPDGTTDAEIERRAIESSHYYDFYRGKNTDGSYFMSFVGEFLPPKKLPPNLSKTSQKPPTNLSKTSQALPRTFQKTSKNISKTLRTNNCRS